MKNKISRPSGSQQKHYWEALLYLKKAIKWSCRVEISEEHCIYARKNVLALQAEEPNQIETSELPNVSSPRKIWTLEEEV